MSFFKSNNRIRNVFIVILSISLILLIYALLNHLFSFSVPCIFHKITGLYCPGCGITRGLASLALGNFYQALRYNILLISVLPFIIILIIDYICSYIKKRDTIIISKISNKAWYILLIITILFGILRNIIPYLAPTNVS